MAAEPDIPNEAGDWIEGYARAGYLVKGVVYVLVGALALQVAIGAGGSTTGSAGALATILRPPFGQVLLLLTGIGLLGHSLWRLLQGALDLEGKGTDGKGLLKRFGYLVSGIAYGNLGLEAFRLVFNVAAGGDADAVESWTGRILSAPLGGWLVAGGAAVMGALCVNAVVVAVGRLYRKKLDLAAMNRLERGFAHVAAIAGLLGRGAVFGLIGLLLVRAAIGKDPQQAGSSEEALALLLRWPAGAWLLSSVAVGLIAYGAFAAVQARYRRMDV